MDDTSPSAELVVARRPMAAAINIVLHWLFIFAVILVVAHHPSWPCLAAAIVIIGVEQSALGLWMHEGAHWLIARNKTVNDLMTTVLVSGPILVPFNAYRQRHFTHHRHLGTAQDTKTIIFSRLDGRRFWSFVLRNCLGLQLVTIAKGYLAGRTPAAARVRHWTPRWTLDVVAMVAAQGLLLWLLGQVAASCYLWLWLVPWLTVNRFVTALRGVIEHHPLAVEQHPFTRRLQPTLLDRFLFCSQVGYERHWAHHRHPDIPCFNLHRVDGDPAPLVGARRGYLQTLSALIRSSPEGPLRRYTGPSTHRASPGVTADRTAH